MGIEENKRAVLTYLGAMGSEAALAQLADDARWWLPRLGAIPFAELAKISERVGKKLTSRVAMTIDHVTAEGDRVSVEAHGHADTACGLGYDNVYHFLFLLRDGKIYEIHEHGDSAYAHRILGFNPTEHLEAR